MEHECNNTKNASNQQCYYELASNNCQITQLLEGLKDSTGDGEILEQSNFEVQRDSMNVTPAASVNRFFFSLK